MALEYGAEKIISYEQDQNRYLLGLYLISKLGLENKIELLHKRFDCTDHFSEEYVYISEIVDTNLWAEGLWKVIPRMQGINMIPNNMFLEIHILEIDQSIINGLYYEHIDGFNPGVKVPQHFVDLVNSLAFNNFFMPNKHLDIGINYFPYQKNNDYNRLVYTSDPVAYYEVDINKSQLSLKDDFNFYHNNIDFTTEKIELKISNEKYKNGKFIVIPRVGLRHHNKKLYLDLACWGKFDAPVILNNLSSTLSIAHNLFNGNLKYNIL
jgi:hypothetical protein